MARKFTEDQLAEQAQRATKLHRLTEYPEWAELVKTMEERREVHALQLAKRMMRGSLIPQEEMLRHTGYWEGVFAVLKTPGRVEKRLKEMLDTAESAQQEGDTQ